MHGTYPGKEQPYPQQMTRYLDPVLLWTVATTATSRVRLNAILWIVGYARPAGSRTTLPWGWPDMLSLTAFRHSSRG
jgi:hypothetical protein